jgi:acetylornithine/succinyldiaminopimelate/putrescine aminotransferase
MSLREWAAYTRLPVRVTGAEGCELVLAAGPGEKSGRRVLDLYGGHCVNTLGAGDPALGQRLAEQWRSVSFVTNLLDHAPRHEFLAAFEPTLPPGEWVVFA